jgi:hypothetical protein
MAIVVCFAVERYNHNLGDLEFQFFEESGQEYIDPWTPGSLRSMGIGIGSGIDEFPSSM